MLQKIKTWMLPLAMLSGAFFYEFFQQLAFLTPYLIFSMLFITYCKLSFRDLKFSGLHLWLLAVQVFGGLRWIGVVRSGRGTGRSDLCFGTDRNGCCSDHGNARRKCRLSGGIYFDE